MAVKNIAAFGIYPDQGSANLLYRNLSLRSLPTDYIRYSNVYHSRVFVRVTDKSHLPKV